MRKEITLDNLLDRLKSGDPETLIDALDESVDLVSEISKAAVQQINHPSIGLFVAERIYQLTAAVMNDVEQLLHSSAPSSEKTLAAVILLLLGSKAGVSHLLKTLEQQEADSLFAANKLAQAGIVEAADGIIALLRHRDFEDPLIAITLIGNLEKLQVPLPADLKNEFSTEDAHPWIRKVVLGEMPPLPSLLPRQPQDGTLRA